MSWRPAGWQNPYPKTIVDECSGIEVNSGKYPIFEAGADAMLKALRKRGRGLHLPGNVPTDNAEGLVRIPLALKNVPQTIVIIPDDVEEATYPLICGSCHTRHSPEEACPQRE